MTDSPPPPRVPPTAAFLVGQMLAHQDCPVWSRARVEETLRAAGFTSPSSVDEAITHLVEQQLIAADSETDTVRLLVRS